MIESAFSSLSLSNNIDEVYAPITKRPITANRQMKNPKLELMKNDRCLDIDKANVRLVKSITDINSRPQASEFSGCVKSQHAKTQAQTKSLNQRLKHAQKIQSENLRILKKLESASSKSNYGRDKMMSEWSKNRELAARISTFSKQPRSNLSSSNLTTGSNTPIRCLSVT